MIIIQEAQVEIVLLFIDEIGAVLWVERWESMLSSPKKTINFMFCNHIFYTNSFNEQTW